MAEKKKDDSLVPVVKLERGPTEPAHVHAARILFHRIEVLLDEHAVRETRAGMDCAIAKAKAQEAWKWTKEALHAPHVNVVAEGRAGLLNL